MEYTDFEDIFCNQFSEKLDNVDRLVYKTETEYRELMSGNLSSKSDQFDQEYKALTDNLKELNRKLSNLRNIKSNRPNAAEMNRKTHITRTKLKKEIEELKLKIQDLQYEMRGRLEHECKTEEEKKIEMDKFRARFSS